MGLARPICAYLDLSGPIWACLSQSGPIWAYLGLSGPICVYLSLSGPIWAYLDAAPAYMLSERMPRREAPPRARARAARVRLRAFGAHAKTPGIAKHGFTRKFIFT